MQNRFYRGQCPCQSLERLRQVLLSLLVLLEEVLAEQPWRCELDCVATLMLVTRVLLLMHQLAFLLESYIADLLLLLVSTLMSCRRPLLLSLSSLAELLA